MKKLLYFLRLYKNKLLLMIGLLFIQVMGTLYIPTLTADIVNNGIVTGDLDHVWKTGGFMLLTAVVTAVFSVLGTYTSTYISTSMGCDIRGAATPSLLVLVLLKFKGLQPVNCIGSPVS